jgi:RNA recognition motif-containing protein
VQLEIRRATPPGQKGPVQYDTPDNEHIEPEQGKIFVGGLHVDVTEDIFRDHFEKYGRVSEALIMTDRATGRSRGFGFITFADHRVVDHVVQVAGEIRFFGRQVEIRRAIPKGKAPPVAKPTPKPPPAAPSGSGSGSTQQQLMMQYYQMFMMQAMQHYGITPDQATQVGNDANQVEAPKTDEIHPPASDNRGVSPIYRDTVEQDVDMGRRSGSASRQEADMDRRRHDRYDDRNRHEEHRGYDGDKKHGRRRSRSPRHTRDSPSRHARYDSPGRSGRTSDYKHPSSKPYYQHDSKHPRDHHADSTHPRDHHRSSRR